MSIRHVSAAESLTHFGELVYSLLYALDNPEKTKLFANLSTTVSVGFYPSIEIFFSRSLASFSFYFRFSFRFGCWKFNVYMNVISLSRVGTKNYGEIAKIIFCAENVIWKSSI